MATLIESKITAKPDAPAVISRLQELANPEIAAHSQRYFKTGKGEYGEGDKFLGIRVPILRKQVNQFKTLSIPEIRKLLRSEYHEVRLLGLLIMVKQFANAPTEQQDKLYQLYLRHTRFINNWDLIDSSAPQIIGAWLMDKDRSILYALAKSNLVWERRIAIMATACFIDKDDFADTLKIAALLLNDDHDLIHKAVGWMLREIGKRNRQQEERFLKKHYQNMPRTMLRYAIEKFDEEKRQQYLKGLI